MSSNLSPDVTSSGPGRDTALRQLLRPLAVFLEDRAVSELAINRPLEVWTQAGHGWERYEALELTPEYLRALTTAMAVFNSLPLAEALSVMLPGGERCQVVREPACVSGWTPVTIRKHAPATWTLDELARRGVFAGARDVSLHRPSVEEAQRLLSDQGVSRLEADEVELLAMKREGRLTEFCRAAVRHRRNVVIAGKTCSGKTTLARALLAEVPSTERVVTIEDVHELDLPSHPNRVPLLYGRGEETVSAHACLQMCMRLSPDRIFLGELRGSEAWEYVMSLNTGHPGSVTTTHANSARHTVERIATLIKNSDVGRTLDLGEIRRVLNTTLDVVLFMSDRRVTQVLYDPIMRGQFAGGGDRAIQSWGRAQTER
jgi:type IV secretion system protein VirB11